MASQRHKLLVQNTTSAGEIIAQGELAPGYVQQLDAPAIPLAGDPPPLDVPMGPEGGPLAGSSLAGPLPASYEPPEPPEPEVAAVVITSPEEGATVPPVHDIVGTGALADAAVDLWYAGQDPGEDPPASTTTADAEGNWGFTGDTPAALGPVTWGVYSGGSLATVNITVAEEGPVARVAKRTRRTEDK